MADVPEVGPWAEAKLDRLGKYLAAYTTVFHGTNERRRKRGLKPFKTVYVDAFAGAGAARIRDGEATATGGEALPFVATVRDQDIGVQRVIAGSPRRALDIPHPFDAYVFVEQAPDRLAILEGLRTEFAERLGAERVRIRPGDCNAYLLELLDSKRVNWREWRAVVFLDPFGMHVPWETVRRLGETGAVEVFINFPLHMCIQRFLRTRVEEITPAEVARLDGYFGDHGWFDQAYERVADMFGKERVEKRADANRRLLAWYRNRLAEHFGFVSSPGLITNTVGGPLYFLLHAGPNKTGSRIASDVLARSTTK